MAETQYDVIIIGGGPGGYVAAIRAAQLGMKVGLVEKQWMGGVCLNIGCIPSKALLHNAAVIRNFQDAKEYGITVGEWTANYEVAYTRSRNVSNRLVKGVEFLMKKNKIDVFKDEAVLTPQKGIELKGGQKLSAKNIILATGARPRSIPGLDLDGKNVISSWEAIMLREVPTPIVIVGASAIGVEFATVYRAYGADITILEALPHLLPKEDEEVSREFEKQMTKAGIKWKTNAKVERAEVKEGQINLQVTTPQGSETVPAQKVLVAVGIQPNSDNIGLEALGVKIDRGAIVVDDYMQTNVPGIYAIGDVTMKLALAHVASAQGILAVEHMAKKEPRSLDYNSIPRCTYSNPQVASFGLTEAQAQERGADYSIGKFPFQANGKALGLNDYAGFIKIIADKKFGEILGVHMIGPEVTDLTGEFSLAMSMEMTPLEIAHAVHAHPTLTEVVGEAALATMGEAIHI
ncbi:MAG: dihydrolipoyl dehydrogenase [Anaerolineae bacterium]